MKRACDDGDGKSGTCQGGVRVEDSRDCVHVCQRAAHVGGCGLDEEEGRRRRMSMGAPAAKAPTMIDAPISRARCSCWVRCRMSMQESDDGAAE